MYDQILAHVKLRPRPDLVFLTGDLAFGGTQPEYDQLLANFLTPLRAHLGKSCLFFSVPGNHDVDRAASIKPRLWIEDAEECRLFQSPDEKGARKRVEVLGPRFAAYATFDSQMSDWGVDWIRSADGTAGWNGRLNDIDVAVVGVNTAWLSQDDDDAGRLTPGRLLFEKALETAVASKPQLLFVLGHHPLEALANEHPPHGDGRRVRERLKQANAIYLHGHLHTTDSEAFGRNDRTALAIQAPSAFQAHDSDIWRNGLLWGEADPPTGDLILEPFEWDEHRSEYKFDLGAAYNDERVPGRDAFRIRLPRPGDSAAAAAPASSVDLPEGWEIVDNALLQELRGSPPSKEEIIGFFDGRLPTWRLVVAPGLQPRAVAENLATRFRAMHDGPAKPGVVLLTAAGGEGKSTAILQAAAILIDSDAQSWKCLYRRSASAALPDDLFSRLPSIRGTSWLVVIDDADTVASSVLAAIKRVAPRTDVHLLLAARDADWQGAKVATSSWQTSVDFRVQSLRGLTQGDAERIVAGWLAYGPEAMGMLRSREKADAAKILVGHARDLATQKEQGELLGALLITRQGDDMRSHVRTLLSGLPSGKVIGSHSILDIYAMIAAFHAENQLYLSTAVLAFALGCSPDELEKKALNLLRREAMLDSGEAALLTRHRRIAEAAIAVLREDGVDVDRWYPFLAVGALRHRQAGRDTPNFEDWCFRLARHFANKGKSWGPLARHVARAVQTADPGFHTLTALSSICRDTDAPDEAMQAFRRSANVARLQRGALREWSIVAGCLRDYGLNVWLAGKAISDDTIGGERKWSQSLLILALAFRNLYALTEEPNYERGRIACCRAVSLIGTENAKEDAFMHEHMLGVDAKKFAAITPRQAAADIASAVIAASYRVSDEDSVEFEKLIGDSEDYRYMRLVERMMEHKTIDPT